MDSKAKMRGKKDRYYGNNKIEYDGIFSFGSNKVQPDRY